MRVQLANPAAHQRAAALPFRTRLDDWDIDGLHPVLGLHRHVVRLVELGDVSYVVKELPDDLVLREYRLLRALADDGLPTAEVVAAITGKTDAGEPVDGMLVTRYLDYSLPYRSLLSGRGLTITALGERLADALVGLLVRLHLAGFYWGDCSLSNTLFRRDAGALSAYIIDLETAERYPSLSDGQRRLDLMIAVENVLGGLLDLEHAGILIDGIDPVGLATNVEECYGLLWDEVTGAEESPTYDVMQLERRLERLHDLGFDVDEIELVQSDDGERTRLVPRVVEHGYHTERLRSLTGLVTQENQARRLLHDIHCFGAALQDQTGVSLPDNIVAVRWLDQRFERAIGRIPPDLFSRLQAAEIFHQLLEHHWFLLEQRPQITLDDAIESYIVDVLISAPDERLRIEEPTQEIPMVDHGSSP